MRARRCKWLFAGLSVTLASSAIGQPLAVQHAETNSPGAAFVSTTLPAPSGVGNIVLVAIFHFAGGSVSSITDSTGTSFQRVVSAVGSAGFAGATLSVYSGAVPASVAVPNAVFVTGPFPAYVEVVVTEYAGLPGAAADLTDTTPAVVGATSVTGPSMSGQRDDLLFWWLACEGAIAGADGGFTLRASINGDVVADLFAPAAGSFTPTATGECATTVSALVRIPSRRDAGVPGADGGMSDAGSADAGAIDAGELDAGPATDAGLADDGGTLTDAGTADGGVLRREPYTVGCDCSAAPLGTLAFAVLIALGQRRQPAR